MRDAGSPTLFVSHHSSKLATAEHVEKALAARGVRCWIAPRDVDPGEPFDRAVHKAIADTDAMLLLFCSRSEKSRHVKRELILADQLHKTIIPLRLERIDPGELSYHLADSQWIDWLEQRDDVIERIAAKARDLSSESGARAATDVGGASDVSGDVADAVPSHSAAVGAASDPQPHGLAAFAQPAAADWQASAPAWGSPAHAPPTAGAGEGGLPAQDRKFPWLWIGLGTAALIGVIAVILLLTMRGGSKEVTAEWFAGVWSDTRDCRDPYRFDRSGQITFPNGIQGRWRIEDGGTLVVEAVGNTIRKQITRVADDEISAPGEGSTYRCFPGAT